ncbi:MAG: ATP-binding protein, partial [Chloroflexota bacterium]|nr:ATP-binding protein [Chloroflexota bacterium]
ELGTLIAERNLRGLDEFMAQFMPLYASDISRLFILTPAGDLLAAFPAGQARGTDLSHTEYFLRASDSTPVSAVLRTADDRAEVMVTIPITDRAGDRIGLLCAAVDLVLLRQWIAPLSQLFDEVYVIDQRGNLVVGNGGTDATPLRDLSTDLNVASVLTGHAILGVSDDLFSGEIRFVAASRVLHVPWYVFAANSPLPSTTRLAQLTDGLLALRLILLGLLLAGGVVLSLTTLRQQRLAMEDLMRLNKAKSDFVSVVSHEFRTPLTGIMGFSEMIRDEELTPTETKDFAADINKDANRLSRMITEMLDLDRMEAGRMQADRELIDLDAILRETSARQGANAPSYQIALKIADALPQIWADRDRITQVLTNLISNAIKYSPDGGAIEVGAEVQKDMAHVWVRDHGMGIPEGSIEEVFERYSRLQNTKTRTIKGTGLGLPIVREIAKMHGGRAWAESTLGSGSTFHVTLPIDPRAAK